MFGGVLRLLIEYIQIGPHHEPRLLVTPSSKVRFQNKIESVSLLFLC